MMVLPSALARLPTIMEVHARQGGTALPSSSNSSSSGAATAAARAGSERAGACAARLSGCSRILCCARNRS